MAMFANVIYGVHCCANRFWELLTPSFMRVVAIAAKFVALALFLALRRFQEKFRLRLGSELKSYFRRNQSFGPETIKTNDLECIFVNVVLQMFKNPKTTNFLQR